jgi:hypothetical protein
MLMVAPDSDIPVQNPTVNPSPPPGDGRALMAFRVLFRDAAARCMRREFKSLRSTRAAVRSAHDFHEKATVFLVEHRSYVASAFGPAVESFTRCLGCEAPQLDGVVDSYLERTKTDLATLIAASDHLSQEAWEARAEFVGDAALELVFRAVKRARFGLEAA